MFNDILEDLRILVGKHFWVPCAEPKELYGFIPHEFSRPLLVNTIATNMIYNNSSFGYWQFQFCLYRLCSTNKLTKYFEMLIKEGRFDEEAYLLGAEIIVTSVALQLSCEELLQLHSLGICGQVVSGLTIHQLIMRLDRRPEISENYL